MLNSIIAAIVGFCTRFAWLVIAVAVGLTGASAVYTARHFAINTDITKLISPDLPWRQRELEFEKVFPQSFERILAVVDSATPEMTSAAAKSLTDKLASRKNLFRSVQQAGGGEFFQRNGLLFLPTEDVSQTMRKLTQAGPLLGIVAADQTLRGLAQGLSVAFIGIQRNRVTLNDMAFTFNSVADTADAVLAGKPAAFSWRVLLQQKPAETSDKRRIVDAWAVMDYGDLEPGQKSTAGLRKDVADLHLDRDYGARVRLTGPVPIADEEFGSLKENAWLNSTVTIALVLVILWLALRSERIILSVFLSLLAGLAYTAAIGLMLVSALNPISIAFAVLFVGLGVDFGIQFSVRYRAERHAKDDLRIALGNAGRRAGAPLTLAAAAVAAGFLSFLPTAYTGLSELGMIAGSGMVIAYLTSITLLPALLQIFNPPGEPERLGYAVLAPADRFLDRQRIPVIVGTGILVFAGLPLLYFLKFDFNPLNLRNPNTESISTYLELKSDPAAHANAIQVLAPTTQQAKAIGEKLGKLPQVGQVFTLDSFVPTQQQEKLGLIQATARQLQPSLNPTATKPPLNDADRLNALTATAASLTRVSGQDQGAGGVAGRRLADSLTKLAQAGADKRTQFESALIRPLKIALDELRESLQPKPVTLETLPRELVEQWVARDGRTRVEAIAAGDTNDNETIREFGRAVLAVEPNATGEAIGILESGRTVVRAFIEAGFWSLTSIAILLWIVLRKFGDVLLTLIPLVLAGVLTLEICVLIGLALNFANIIALPLLLGVGVAFKIYYVMAWRAGQTNLLQSTLTRAVFFSALTTATAFGSMWFSSHPGTSSMGKLMALALLTTMLAAVFFQPALMGRPRNAR